MKRKNIIPALFFSLSAVFAQPNYIGTWKGIDTKGIEGTLILSQDNSATIEIGKRILGIRDPLRNTLGITVKYEFDFTKDPVWLDFYIYNSRKQIINTMKTIVKFEGGDKMEWAIGANPNIRPESIDLFHDEQNTLILFKVR